MYMFCNAHLHIHSNGVNLSSICIGIYVYIQNKTLLLYSRLQNIQSCANIIFVKTIANGVLKRRLFLISV